MEFEIKGCEIILSKIVGFGATVDEIVDLVDEAIVGFGSFRRVAGAYLSPFSFSRAEAASIRSPSATPLSPTEPEEGGEAKSFCCFDFTCSFNFFGCLQIGIVLSI